MHAKQKKMAEKNRAVLMYSAAVVRLNFLLCQSKTEFCKFPSTQIVLAAGATYAAVPLYRIFCATTGFAGTPKVGTGRFDPSRLVPISTPNPDSPGTTRRIRVHFNADRSDLLPWTFTPQQKYVDVLPGETSLAFYQAKNFGERDVIGIATYNVTPDRVCTPPSSCRVCGSGPGH